MSKTFAQHTFIEFGPLTLFFFVSWIWGFFPGATALVVSTFLALVYSLVHFKRFAIFSFTASALVLVFGTLTIWLHNPVFLVLEYTLSNAILGVVLVGSYFYGHPLLRDLFSHMFSISRKGWMILTVRWGLVFIIAGITNHIFWELYPNEDAWALFRFFATLLTFLFGISQLLVSKRERLPDSSAWGLKH